MGHLLVITADPAGPDALGALTLLGHHLTTASSAVDAMALVGDFDAVVVDARTDLAQARTACKLVAASSGPPVLLMVAEDGFAVVRSDWQVADLVRDSASPAELDARLRLLLDADAEGGLVTSGPVVIDEAGYHASVNGRPLDLTYTEFELLRYLAQHPGRAFSRDQILAGVWGVDYYGGTRTVDVHVRRLRAKLSPEYEWLIGTVRNVGYRFSPGAGARGGV